MIITSLKNEQVKYWVKLNDKHFRDKERLFLVEGDHLVSEARKYGKLKYVISTTDEDADFYVTKEIMKKISNQVTAPSVIGVVEYLDSCKEVEGNVLILDGVQDPGNLGTIIRSARAFNFNNIVLSNDSVDLYNDKVIRSTEGMIFNMNILRCDLLKFISTLKGKYKIIGTDVCSGIDVKEIAKENIAIIIGNEGNGISSNIKNLCDEFIHINMNPSVESLNAGVSASIIMYEVYNG